MKKKKKKKQCHGINMTPLNTVYVFFPPLIVSSLDLCMTINPEDFKDFFFSLILKKNKKTNRLTKAYWTGLNLKTQGCA